MVIEMKCNFTPKYSVALCTKRVSFAITGAILGGTRRHSAEGNGWSLSEAYCVDLSKLAPGTDYGTYFLPEPESFRAPCSLL